jgi:hypothetical protein
LQDKLNTIQNSTFAANDQLEQFRLQMNWNQVGAITRSLSCSSITLAFMFINHSLSCSSITRFHVHQSLAFMFINHSLSYLSITLASMCAVSQSLPAFATKYSPFIPFFPSSYVIPFFPSSYVVPSFLSLHYQEELLQWSLAAKQKDEDKTALEKYKKMDNEKIKQLTLKVEKAAREVQTTKMAVNGAVTESQSTQIELDKASAEYHRLHVQRQQLVKQVRTLFVIYVYLVFEYTMRHFFVLFDTHSHLTTYSHVLL